MAKKRTSDPMPPPRLVLPRAQAAERIQTQIKKGHEIRNLEIRSREDLERAEAERNKWDSYNCELLTRLFDNPSEVRKYTGILVGAGRAATFQGEVNELKIDMKYRITRLESLLARLELIPAPEESPAPSTLAAQRPPLGRRIFIVHGRDEEAKLSVARFLDKLDLDPIILHEQPDKGRTVIEKFEDYSDVGFAVVLLTPDDEGRARDSSEDLRPRGRQNVTFELGFFVGKLGRDRVCALYKEEKRFEFPSDYLGVLYLPLDPGGGWQLKLAQEMKAGGLEVDLNKAIE